MLSFPRTVGVVHDPSRPYPPVSPKRRSPRIERSRAVTGQPFESRSISHDLPCGITRIREHLRYAAARGLTRSSCKPTTNERSLSLRGRPGLAGDPLDRAIPLAAPPRGTGPSRTRVDRADSTYKCKYINVLTWG